jgi:hypothetical protein
VSQEIIMTNLPLPIPAFLDASEEEWRAYMEKLTLDELEELVAVFEDLQRSCHKRKLVDKLIHSEVCRLKPNA